MPRENKTIYAILGLLSASSMSGYEMKHKIKNDIGLFWSESDGQIYPTLKKLLDGELIVLNEPENTVLNKKEKKIYSITKAGKLELKKWLDRYDETFNIRNEFLLKVFFGHRTTPETNIERIYNARFRLKEKLKVLESLKEELISKKDSKSNPCATITVDYGISQITATIQWCEDTIKLLKDSSNSSKQK